MTLIDRAIELLHAGQLVGIPTETVYGLGADATNPRAIEAIFTAKGRPSTNPLIIHMASIEMAHQCAALWPDLAQQLAEKFWPGPLTLVLPKRLPDMGGFLIPDIATAGLDSVALRMPNHPLTLELLRAFGKPLAAPSANRSTRISPTTAKHVRDEFPDETVLPLILDGGPCVVGIESTVLSLLSPPPVILRPGHITRDQLQATIGPVNQPSIEPSDAPALSPGQHLIHYSPITPAYRFEAHDPQPADAPGIGRILITSSPTDYAQSLYSKLRALDSMGLKAILIQMPPDQPQWSAVRDRLMRATRPISDFAPF